MIRQSDIARILAFVLVLAFFALAERLLPRRARGARVGPRWFANLGILTLANALTRLIVPLTAVEAAYRAEAGRFGLMNVFSIYFPIHCLISIVALDLVIYFQHRAFHRFPPLWRAHAVHHTDLDLDASSGVRFHPLEIALSTVIKIAAAVLLGAHFLGVAAFEMLLFAASVFTHANLAVPGDGVLRRFLVTPDMHRIHHSLRAEETNSNFGFCLSWWDRLFGTYRAQPDLDHADMPLGLPDARDPERLGLYALLRRPFLRNP